MITLWLGKHFNEVKAQFRDDIEKIREYYRRFFDYLDMDLVAPKSKTAGR
jgi:hypothetical protein